MNKIGTKEWSDISLNIEKGCPNNCRYCYARYNAIHGQFAYMTQEQWDNPTVDMDKVNKGYRERDGVIMFPTTHDITAKNLVHYYTVLKKLLDASNQVLVVSKPNWYCIKTLCDKLEKYKEQILFRFTIGSTDNEILKFWEPNAPSFDERLKCLQYAFVGGYQTSISCEPFLDDNMAGVYNACKDFLTDSFWIGKLNDIGKRVDLTDVTNEQIERFVNPLKELMSDEIIKKIYNLYDGFAFVKWKDSIRKVVNG